MGTNKDLSKRIRNVESNLSMIGGLLLASAILATESKYGTVILGM
jgi:hypothetical protein